MENHVLVVARSYTRFFCFKRMQQPFGSKLNRRSRNLAVEGHALRVFFFISVICSPVGFLHNNRACFGRATVIGSSSIV